MQKIEKSGNIMKKSKVKTVIGIIVIIICMVYFFADILDLFNTEDKHKVNVVYSYEALEVTHKLFYIIPTGKDHYFLAYDEDSLGNINGYVVKASRDWYEENFSVDTGYILDLENGVEIDTISKSLRPKWSNEISDSAYEFQNLLLDNGTDTIINYPYGLDHCFVIGYKSMAIQKLIMLILNIFVVVIGIIIVKRKSDMNPVFLKVYGVVLIVDVIYFLVLLFNSF